MIEHSDIVKDYLENNSEIDKNDKIIKIHDDKESYIIPKYEYKYAFNGKEYALGSKLYYLRYSKNLELKNEIEELFNRKIMLKCSIQTKNFNYNITKQQLATLEIYNYIYNHAYELLQKILSYCPVTKVFDVITAQQTPEAKELNTLINTFKQNY